MIKNIPSKQAGGLAGSEKFVTKGMFIKFLQDSRVSHPIFMVEILLMISWLEKPAIMTLKVGQIFTQHQKRKIADLKCHC